MRQIHLPKRQGAYFNNSMLNQIKHLGKHTFIYAIGSAIQTLVAFLLVPIYTHYLTPAQYGQLEILNMILLILTMILSFGFASAIIKVHEQDCFTEKEKKETLGTMYLFVMPIASLISLIFFIFSKPITKLLLGDTGEVNLFYLVLGLNIFTIFSMLSFSLLRAKEKSLNYILVSFLRFILTLGINIYLVVELQLGIFGILAGNLMATILASFIFIPFIFKYIKFTISKKYLAKLSYFGVAIIPAAIASWVMDLSDRYYLKHFVDLSEVGIYSLGYKIGMVVSVLMVTPFQLAWPTISYSLAKKDNAKEIYARVLTYFLFISSFVALGLTLFSPQVIEKISPANYARAAIVVPFVAFAYVLYGVHFIIVPGLHLKGKTKYYPLIIGLPAIINLFLNYFFVPQLGMLGAAMTTLLCFMIMVVITYFISNHYYSVKYEWSRILKITLVLSIALISSYYINGEFWQEILYNTLILLSYCGILFLIRFFKKGEIEQFLVILKKIKLQI